MRDKDQELSQAQGRERTAQQMLEQEKANFERTIAESSRAAADKSAQLQATIDARSEEVERQSAKLDRMMQLNDTQVRQAMVPSAAVWVGHKNISSCSAHDCDLRQFSVDRLNHTLTIAIISL